MITNRELDDRARAIRLSVVRMMNNGKTAHLGGACSMADIITALYFYKMRYDPANPQLPHRDRLILSKGHCALVQYACLAMAGFFPEAELDSFKTLGSRLQGHPDHSKLPGIEANTGSLGQGLSIACGMAAANRLDGVDARVYCIVGDGELAEGQIWEAAMCASAFRLDRLAVLVDRNGLQATGATRDRFDTEPIAEKWQAFGWHVAEIDGHDMGQITDALDALDTMSGKPVCIIANTVKGKGIPFAEHVVGFHNGALTPEQVRQASSHLTRGGVA